MGKRTKANKAKRHGGTEASAEVAAALPGAEIKEEVKPRTKDDVLSDIRDSVAVDGETTELETEALKLGATQTEIDVAKIKSTIEPTITAKTNNGNPMGGWRGGENIGWSLGGELPAEMVGGYHRGKRHSKKAKRGGGLSYSLLGGRRRSGRKTGRRRTGRKSVRKH